MPQAWVALFGLAPVAALASGPADSAGRESRRDSASNVAGCCGLPALEHPIARAVAAGAPPGPSSRTKTVLQPASGGWCAGLPVAVRRCCGLGGCGASCGVEGGRVRVGGGEPGWGAGRQRSGGQCGGFGGGDGSDDARGVVDGAGVLQVGRDDRGDVPDRRAWWGRGRGERDDGEPPRSTTRRPRGMCGLRRRARTRR